MVYVDLPHTLTSFQRWSLLHLHNVNGNNGFNILKACCITAVTDNFQKKDVVDGLKKLEEMELITINPPDNTQSDSRPDRELSGFYAITADGIIYTKKMLRPVLDLIINEENVERIAQRLNDGKTKSWLVSFANKMTNATQQKVLDGIIDYGLGNISGLSQLLDTIRTVL